MKRCRDPGNHSPAPASSGIPLLYCVDVIVERTAIHTKRKCKCMQRTAVERDKTTPRCRSFISICEYLIPFENIHHVDQYRVGIRTEARQMYANDNNKTLKLWKGEENQSPVPRSRWQHYTALP